MVDLSFVGKDGLIVDYEDCISLIGMNVLNYLIENNYQCDLKKISMSSFEDILNSYISREDENISIWLNQFGINGFDDMSKFYSSRNMLKPNLVYAYRIFPCAYENGIKNLYIYSKYESDAIRRIVNETFNVDIKYVYGDIKEVLKDKVNYTYITASPSNVLSCLEVNTPFALTICADYISMSSIIQTHTDDKLRKNGKYVAYTSILSSGGITK